MATIWLRIASGYRLVRTDPERGLFIWERGRGFSDGGFFYYGQVWRDKRTARARFVIGVIGHTYHAADELAAARSQFVSGQLHHLTERSARNALAKARNPRTARAVLSEMRGLIGKQTIRPPAIDVPMSASAQRFTLHAPIEAVESAIAGLQQAGWRLVETASINRGLVAQSRYSFIDATERKDAGAEYVLECRCYEGDWAVLAIDWFPFPDSARLPRRPNEMEADIRSGVARVRTDAELVDQA